MLQASFDRYPEQTKADRLPKRYPAEPYSFPTYSIFCACGCRKEIHQVEYTTQDGEPLASQKCVDDYYADMTDELEPMKEAG